MGDTATVNGNYVHKVNGNDSTTTTYNYKNGFDSAALNEHESDAVNRKSDEIFDIPIERVKRKAKRPSQLVRTSSDTNFPNGHSPPTNGHGPFRYSKNSRKSRNGFGRGLPKKGGAGGKGTWGKLGSELMDDNETPTLDEYDPNYDSDVQIKNCEFVAISPPLSDEDLKNVIEPIILEYFENADTHEAGLSLEELNLGQQYFKIVVLAINLAMDRKPSHCELASVLISDLYGSILKSLDIPKGFSCLLKELSDLVLDTPDAPNILGNFIARAIADDCLAPKFIQYHKDEVDCDDYARTCLNHASTLLNMKHGLVRLDNVWGVGGGIRPVKYLIKKMMLLLKEYLSSCDVQEAIRCIRELEVPHFHHELVFEAIVMVLENMYENPQKLMCKLLKELYDSVIITPEQLNRGFDRVFKAMPDISIDVPFSYCVLEQFCIKCQQAGFLSEMMVKKMPTSRGRKRFVSEGDGGRIKEVYN